MNLLPLHFSQSPLGPVLAGWENCEYAGEPSPGILKYRLSKAETQAVLLVATVIRKEEDLVWKSCHELLDRTLKTSVQSMQGFFGFQLLTLELGDKIRSFQWENFRQYIVNLARPMGVGEEKLVQYTSLFGILKKRVAEMYGKMDYQSAIKIYSKEPAQLDLLVKKILKEGESQNPIGVIHDLSLEPIFRFGDEEQTSRLQKLLEKIKAGGTLPEFYILDGRGVCELGAQFGWRSDV